MKTLHTSMKEMEAKKRVLEEAVDALNEEMSKVRAEGKLTVLVETLFKHSGTTNTAS